MAIEPRLVFFEDLRVGMEMWGTTQIADRDEMVAYAERYDPWPMYVDEDQAARSRFGRITASGGYTMSLWFRSSHGIWQRPEWTLAFLGGTHWEAQYPQPLYPGELVRARSAITHLRASSRPRRGVVSYTSDLLNDAGDSFLTVEAAFLIATTPGGGR